MAPTAAGGAFSGAARTLAGGGEAATAPDAPAAAGAAPSTPPPVVIDFYSDGTFTVDGGPPRDAADPAERPFLAALAAGECPPELEAAAAAAAAAAGGGPPVPVPVSLVRHAGPYEPPAEPAYVPFSGAGRTLGGGGGGASAPGPSSAPPPPAPAPASGASVHTWPGADPSQPTTSIQVRLADGTRLVGTFNLTQAVGEIRAFISAAAPPGSSLPSSYTLARAGMPPSPLNDEGLTIQEAGLAGSVVAQRPA